MVWALPKTAGSSNAESKADVYESLCGRLEGYRVTRKGKICLNSFDTWVPQTLAPPASPMRVSPVYIRLCCCSLLACCLCLCPLSLRHQRGDRIPLILPPFFQVEKRTFVANGRAMHSSTRCRCLQSEPVIVDMVWTTRKALYKHCFPQLTDKLNLYFVFDFWRNESKLLVDSRFNLQLVLRC